MEDIFSQVQRNIDALVEGHVMWAETATPEQLQSAREGRLSLTFGADGVIPAKWLGDLTGRRVLCLAGAGGLQAPLMACAGAEVTVLDLSERMLDKDREIAAREGLRIRIEQGNMCDLSRFADASFDLVFNPPSLCYVPDVNPVFREVYRVLKPGGTFITTSMNPLAYICDWDEAAQCYKAVNRLPYSAQDHDGQGAWIEYGHTMESYLGGQIAAGFVITGYLENQTADITELYFITKAEKR